MKLYIKNMVCSRCKMVVESELIKFGLHPLVVNLGEVDIEETELDSKQKSQLNGKLMSFGFEIIDDKKSRLIERIKNAIVELVHYSDEQLKVNLSHHISNHLNLDYSYLSNLFTEVEGTTIEKYFIAQKIEKVKELILYDELSLSEIADKLNYGSVSYLSKQFKKVTGLTPSHFKQVRERKRKSIEEL
ncbi:MAG: AraC family transcriptional regulator [Bacteroidota bacterium]